MNWYRVTRADGSYSWVQATSKSEASQKVRYTGEMIKAVKEVDEGDVPAEARGTTPTTPTPTPTTPTTTTKKYYLTVPGHNESYEIIGATSLAEAESIAKGWGIGGVVSTSPVGKVRTTPTPTPPTEPAVDTGGWTDAQIGEFEAYREDVDSGRFPNLPSYDTIGEFWKNRNSITANQDWYFSKVSATAAQWQEWERFQAFGSKYGDLNDYSPANFADFINNYDKSIGQLNAWTQEAGPEATGFTDAQLQRLNDYKQWYYTYGKPGDLMPVDAGDFIANEEKYQQQLNEWQKIADLAISPEEALRRQEESYAEGRVAAGERYKETPQYQPPFTQWLGEQGQFSGALEQFVESQYPSLRSEFQAGMPRLTGFPTPGAARGEAERREQAWQGWLGGRTPELEQKYWGQRPAQRGERLWMQQPTLRTANW